MTRRTVESRLVFRSTFNKTVSILLWVVCAIIVGSLIAAGEPRALVFTVIPALGAYLTWLLYWNPAVVIDDDGVCFVNATRTVEIPWAAIIGVDTRYSLSVRTPRAVYSALAAPAPGATGTYSANRDVRVSRHSDVPDPSAIRRPSDLPRTDSGAAASMVLDRWNSLTEAGLIPLGVANDTPVTVTWHVAQLAVLVALVAASVASLAAL
jgi:hypothetical protein